MNIFVLDDQPEIAAQMMCDKHVVKMILESCQLMSTAHHVLDGDVVIVNTGSRKYKTSICTTKNICKATMINHPCNVWARETTTNYMWLWRHARSLCAEYTLRYGKVHSMQEMIMGGLYTAPKNACKGKRTPFVQAMPDQYKHENAITAYRQYYLGEKAKFAKWKTGKIPAWYANNSPIYIEEPIPF